jgi:hypothetical protein
MIVVSDVNGTPNNNRDDNWPDYPDPEPDPDGQPTTGAVLWRAFTDWVDRYAWTIIVLGVALILLDVLLVLLVLLYQVNR